MSEEEPLSLERVRLPNSGPATLIPYWKELVGVMFLLNIIFASINTLLAKKTRLGRSSAERW
jgi:hypothetical protein